MTDNTIPPICEKLREKARRTSDFSRQLAEAKSLRQGDNPEGRADLYEWEQPEQTLEWQAAETVIALVSALEMARDCLSALICVNCNAPSCEAARQRLAEIDTTLTSIMKAADHEAG